TRCPSSPGKCRISFHPVAITLDDSKQDHRLRYRCASGTGFAYVRIDKNSLVVDSAPGRLMGEMTRQVSGGRGAWGAASGSWARLSSWPSARAVSPAFFSRRLCTWPVARPPRHAPTKHARVGT